MDQTHFSRSLQDVSRPPHDVDAGFQLDFRCERCQDTWRSVLTPYRPGQVAGWLSRTASMLGRSLVYNAERAASDRADAGWGMAKDFAMKAALLQARQHFHRCAKRQEQVCPTRWDTRKGLCLNTAPDLQAEVEAARSSAVVETARARAQAVGQEQPQAVDVASPSTNACPRGKAMTRGGKFCPECGTRMAQA